MKRLIFATAILLGGLTAVTAQTESKNLATQTSQEVRLEIHEKSYDVQDFKEVDVSELPQKVKDEIAKKYSGSSISKAYVNARGEYKLQLATADQKKTTVYTDVKGELKQNELKKQ